MSPTAPRATRREWVGLGVLALPCLVYSMDLTVLYLALPKLSTELDPTGTELLWITDVYGFFLAGFLITMGTLGDRVGRRRLLLTGAVAFSLASLLAAFSTTAPMLVVARALMGVAAASLAPSTLSLIRNMFLDERQRTFAIAIWIASFSAGAAIGPLVGGALLQFFWWGSVFLAALPVMGLLLLLGPVLLPEFRDPRAGRLDVVSAALSLLSVLALIYGLKQIAAVGLDLHALASLVVGTGAAVVFVRRQATLDDPLLDVGLFRRAPFAVAVAAMCLAVFVVAGTDFFLGQYLQLVSGKSPFVAGLWLLPGVGGLVAGSLVAPAVAARARPGHVLIAGLVLASAGTATLTQLRPGEGLAALVAGTTLIGLGAGVVGTLATDFVIGATPAERAGAGSAISETAAELGGALGVAILGSIGVAVYRSDVGAQAPVALGDDELEQSKASLGAAVELGGSLSARLHADVVDVARGAFAHGLHAGAVSAAVVAAALAALAALVLRGSAPAAISAADDPAVASRDRT